MNHNTIQHKNWFFLFALYIINTSNEDFKFAIKKLVYIYYNKIKVFIIEESLYPIKYFSFSKITIALAYKTIFDCRLNS